jgi:predicted enzyme related to lactoylglutathione lyase
MAGQFTWLDLMTNDPNGAVPFYKAVLGWETETWQGNTAGMPPYTMWKASGESFGGTAPHSEDAQKTGAPPLWLGYVSTDDLDASLRKAESLGARVYVGKTAIPDTGWFAVLADPQGATFALYQRAAERPVTGDGSLRILSWTELATTDVEAACDFYGKLCGWHKTDAMEMPEGAGTYQMFGSGGKSMGGMMRKNAELPAPSWFFYFKVDDCRKRYDAAIAAGAKGMYGPMEVPGGDIAAMLVDPQGGAFGIVSAKTAV